MRIIIAGSRSATKDEVYSAIYSCNWINIAETIISGTAKGADEFGEIWASEQGIKINRYPAEWNKYGKRAGPLRNEVMAKNADGLVAVWDGKSRGTRSMIDLAKKHGLKIFIYRTDLVEDQREYLEERIAILMYDAGMSEYDARKLAYKLMVEHFKLLTNT